MVELICNLEVGKTYKCIDVDRYTSRHSSNTRYWAEHSKEGSYTLDNVDEFYGEGYIEGCCVISKVETCYFELVEDNTNYWDGKVKLAVGMTVTTNTHTAWEIVFLSKGKAVLESGEITQMVDISEVQSMLPDPKEEFIKEITTQWRNQGIDFAHDNTADISNLAAMCYDKLNGVVDE